MIKDTEPIVYAKYFFLILGIAVILSLGYKAVLLISQSTFKHNTFNILLISKGQRIIHVDSENKKIVTQEIENTKKVNSKESIVEQSTNLGLLIDGSIIATNNAEVKNVSLSILFNSYDYKLKNINQFDLLKIILYSYIFENETKPWQDPNESNLYVDSQIANEKVSVEITNATDTDGLGGKFAQALKNTGYNVVSVKSNNKQKSRIIGSDLSSGSINRLKNALRITPEIPSGSQAISDIIVILGPDLLKSNK